MEFDFTTILYILFGLIYFVFTGAAKKRKREQNQGPPDSSQPEDATETLGPPPTGRRPSFEELLEEFTTGKKADIEPEPIPVVPEVEIIEPAPKPNIYMEALEARKSGTAEPATFTRFEEFEQEEEMLSPYAQLMREPDGAKKAFVLSEIFNRKY